MPLDPHLIAKTAPLANPNNIIHWGNFRVTVLFDRLFRVEEDASGTFCDEATLTVWFRDMPAVPFETTEQDGKLYVKTAKATLVLGACREESYVILDDRNVALDNSQNLCGTEPTLDCCDGELKFIPGWGFFKLPLTMGVLSKNGVAVWEDTEAAVLGADGMIQTTRPDTMDIYIFAYGHDYRAALRDYYAITGATPKLPRYALGNWWSRYHEYTDREYLGILDRMAERDIPLTVATVDMDWHWNSNNLDRAKGITAAGKNDEAHGGANGWTGYSWNTEFFPDYKGFLKKVHDRGCAVTLNLHPADGLRWFEDMYEDMAKAMGRDPADETPIRVDFTDPDFINNYFKIMHKPYEADGVDFWWIDWQQGAHAKDDGIDIMWALNHYHTLDNGKHHTPLTLSRYAKYGAHRYPLGFSGDTFITWDTLRYQPYFTATASNIGFTWWSHDIGGHMGGGKDDELYLRSVQWGVFSPILRLHCSAMDYGTKEPMAYMNGKGLLAEEFLRLRHRMIPYLYSAMLDTSENGKALIEPMYYDYPDTEEAYRFKNQYMFGGQLLVAPVTEPSDRKGMTKTEVWLPEGTWTDIFTGECYEGGRVVPMVRFLDSIPVLAKAGGAFVLDHRKHTNAISTPDHLDVMLFNGNGEYLFREDEGITAFTATTAEGKQTFTVTPDAGVMTRKMTLQMRNIPEGEVTVRADGQAIGAEVAADGYVTVKLDEVKGGVTYTVEIAYTYDRVTYRNTRLQDALTRLEVSHGLKEGIWVMREQDDRYLRNGIRVAVDLTDNEKIKLTEAW